MATFISLYNFTDQGIKNVKESPKRAEAVKAMAAKMGVTIKDIYWTVGSYDMVVVRDGPEDAVTSLLLKVGSLGDIRSQTLRAYSASEFGKLVANI